MGKMKVLTVCLALFCGAIFSDPNPINTENNKEYYYGYCGDGIRNGGEICDKADMWFTSCESLLGVSGELGCSKDCNYDISRCLTPAVDARIGGLSEVCKCSCNSNDCSGGCAQVGEGNRAHCLFRCDNSCTCNCGDKIQAHMNYSQIDCQCANDASGHPQCICSLDESELLTAIRPDIGASIARLAPTDSYFPEPIRPALPTSPVLFPQPRRPLLPPPPSEDDKYSFEGFCGDGIINGFEHCDRDNMQHVGCEELLGYPGGKLGCTIDCTYDISDCLTPAVDRQIGGRTELCKCTCKNADGGCVPVSEGASDCLFRTDDCRCDCEDTMEAHIEYATMDCHCTNDAQGVPECRCSLNESEFITTIKPNIAAIVSMRPRP